MLKGYLSRSALVSVFLVVATWALTARAQNAERYAPNQIIIKFKSSASASDKRAEKAKLNAKTKHEFKSIGAELWELDGVAVPDAVNRYKSDPRVAFVEPNYVVHTNDVIPNDPRFNQLWGMHNTGQTGGTADADIDAPEAWSIKTGGTVLVGVIDTGVDWHHPDLAANIFTNLNEIPDNHTDDDANGYVDDVHGWDFINGDSDPVDDNGHGTHCSGTIAAIGNNELGVVGVSWSARILPLKFLDYDGYGYTSDAIRAVEYATKMGVRLTSNSWGGGGYSQALYDAIAEAGNHGILFVAAAGNYAEDNDIWDHYPSDYDLDNVISVASTDYRDARSDFSNYGLISVDLGAPGSDILSTLPNSSYGVYSGTSMATPHVSGAVCLAWALSPTMTHLEIKDALLTSVDPLPALEGRVVSGGRLNVHNLLLLLDETAPSRVRHLTVESRGSSTVRLSFTASGDDSTVGTAARYDVRYSKSKITAGNFAAATRASSTPHPAPSGSKESFEVAGLAFNTKYYFALVVEDEVGNRSPVSGSTSGTTFGAPQMAYSPGSFSASLKTGGTVTQLLRLSNTAKGTLDYATVASPSWLKVKPSVGRVNTGKSLQVEIVFDATRVSGGVHDSTVTLATNDPARPTLVLPVSLQVTDAADIAVKPTSVDFGTHYTTTCAHDTLVVRNIGALALNVSSVSVSHPAFSTASGAFSLAPNQSRRIPVSFCPVSVGAAQGTLSFQSNDPDHPAYTVSLSGVGVDPPIIGVAPGSLSADLITGGVSAQTLSISNSGGSDLSFDVGIKNVGGPTAAAGMSSQGQAREKASRDITPVTERPAPTAENTHSYSAGRAPSLSGDSKHAPPVNGTMSNLKVLLVHTGEAEIRDLLLEFPDISVVDKFNAQNTTPDLATLTAYHAVVLLNDNSYENPFALGDVLADYVDANGCVIVTLASFIDGWDVSGRFASGGYSPFTLGYGPLGLGDMSDFDAAHPIMQGVSSAEGDLLGGTTVAPGAKWVAGWDNGQPFIATQGDHVVGVNVFVPYDGYWSGDVPLILHNAIAWGVGAAWLNVEPQRGIVPPGGRVDLAVDFDAARLSGGNYAAHVHVSSNDIVNPAVVVPLSLHVTGAADIAVSQTQMDYGPQFIGAVITRTLVVSNEGTDVLTVSGISLSHPNYTVDISSFTLPPFTSQSVAIAFAPTATGPIAATLSIASSDLDEGVTVVTVGGAGVEPPIISVTPTSLSEALLTGGTATHSIAISNSGATALTYSIAVADQSGPTSSSPKRLSTHEATRVVPPVKIGKGEHDTRTYPPMEHASGGPDEFGYRWRDSNEAGGPRFNWIDVSDGTDISLSDDDFASNIPLGFTFSYYGSEFTTIGVGSNGWVSFVGWEEWFPSNVPWEDGIEGPIAPYARDLYPPSAGYVRYKTFGVAPRRQFVVEYNDIPDWETGRDHKTFEVILTEGTNAIRFQYLVAPNAPIGFGIESPDQTTGMGNAGDDELFISPALVRNDYAIEFSAVPWWILALPADGTVPPHGSVNVNVTFDAAGLFGGDYAANLLIANNDPLNSEVVVSAGLRVTGAPDIALSDALLDYGAQFIGAKINKTLVVSNEGTDLLTVSSISSSHAAYTVDASDFTLAPNETRNVAVTFAPISTGPITANLTISSSDFDEGVLTVELRGSGVKPPVISVVPTSLSEDLLTGETAVHSVTISNSGESDLSFAIGFEESPPSDSAFVDIQGLKAAKPVRTRGPAPVRTEEHVTRSYPAMERTSGGPDAGGYQWRDNNEAGGPTFNWIDAGSGTPLSFQDDDFVQNVPLGFSFRYYGETFTTIDVSAHGWASFNGMDWGLPYEVPSLDYYAGAIAPYAKYLNTSAAEYVRYWTFGVAPRRQFVIEYNQVPDYYEGTAKTFEVILSEGTNTIRFQYLVAPDAPYGFGIESPDETMGMGNGGLDDLFISPELVRDNYVIEFMSIPKWLGAEPMTGIVPPHGSLDVAVTFKATNDVFGGDYAANLRILNNDPLNSDVPVAANLHVTGVADIAVAPTLLAFHSLFIGASTSQTFVVSNDGTDALTGSISSSDPDYALDVASFSLPAKTNRTVTVTFAPTTPGPIPGVLTIASDDPDEPSLTVELQGAGLVPPVIRISPSSLTVNLFSGDKLTETLTVDNSAGGSDLSWVAAILPNPNANPWVNVEPRYGTVPAGTSATINVNFDGGDDLSGGTYDANILFTSNDPITTEVVIPVQMRLAGAPNVTVTPSHFDYGPTFIGYAGFKTFVVSNDGNDVLTVSAVSSNHAAYTVNPLAFDLQPHETHSLVVKFAPTSIDSIAAHVTLISNDPDEAAFSIPLSGIGVAPPAISVTPVAFADSLSTGESSTQSVTVSNSGTGDLSFTVGLGNASRVGSVARVAGDTRASDPARVATIGKGEDDTRSYPPMKRTGGGPDPFGYQWRDSNDPGGPAFDWIDVSGGTNLALEDDDFRKGIPLGFTFGYYGENFETIGVGSNGWLSFNGENIWFPSNVPLADSFAGAIAPYARDLFPPFAVYVRYRTFGVAPNRQFVIEYNSVPDMNGVNHKTFEVILTERANTITFQYLEAPNAPMGFGIESPDQTMGLGNTGAGDRFISPTLVTSHYAIEFSAFPAWLFVTPEKAIIPPGESLELIATLDATELPGGEYAATLFFRSNDPATPVVPVEVSLHVEGAVAMTSLAAVNAVSVRDIPASYALHPNHPNPFNPTTQIAYDLPRAAEVRLVIYDVQGKVVAELLNGTRPAGRHEVTWDGRNASSEPVASGVYFYRLIAADFVQTKKMVLLK